MAVPSPALLREAVACTRGRVLAEAIIVLVLGFVLDDLRMLRVPGFAAGLLGAVAVLASAGLFHGRALAADVADLSPETAKARLHRYRGRGRAAGFLAVLAFIVWLSAVSQGVPPWSV